MKDEINDPQLLRNLPMRVADPHSLKNTIPMKNTSTSDEFGRRRFLRGMGVSLTLPLMESLMPRRSYGAVEPVNDTSLKARASEAVVSVHGKVAVFLQRHTPGFFDFLLRTFAVKG